MLIAVQTVKGAWTRRQGAAKILTGYSGAAELRIPLNTVSNHSRNIEQRTGHACSTSVPASSTRTNHKHSVHIYARRGCSISRDINLAVNYLVQATHSTLIVM